MLKPQTILHDVKQRCCPLPVVESFVPEVGKQMVAGDRDGFRFLPGVPDQRAEDEFGSRCVQKVIARGAAGQDNQLFGRLNIFMAEITF